MAPRKTIAVVTGIRSEYHILKPVMRAVDRHPDLRLEVVVAGTHLDRAFGSTWREVAADFPIAAKVKSLPPGDGLDDRALGLGRQISGLVPVLDAIDPDITCVLGDREESLSVAAVCAYTHRTCAHISGGDNGYGTIDDSVRHAVTKLAHLHFPTTKENRNRIVKLGEEGWRVHAVGASGLDRLREATSESRRDLLVRFDLDDQPFVVVLQHPVSSEAAKAGRQLRTTLTAVRRSGLAAIVVHPNSDAGARAMISELHATARPDNWRVVTTLEGDDWPNALRHAEALVGNSSAGLLEAPFLACPAINVGTRQTARRAGKNLVRVPHRSADILDALDRVRRTAFRKKLQKRENRNIYGDGRSGERIARILAKTEIDERLLNKKQVF